MNMFERVSREQTRWHSSRGNLTVEDLWMLPLTSSKNSPNLNDIAVELDTNLRKSQVSFVDKALPGASGMQLAFDVVKYIIEVRLNENAAKADEKAKAERKQKLLAIISEKQEESLKNMSLEDLQKLLADQS